MSKIETTPISDQILPTNPDAAPVPQNEFLLRPEFIPNHLHPVLGQYQFRRCNLDEISRSSATTQEGWPGIQETTLIDLRARELINSPMCGAFDRQGNLAAYTRLLWGFDNLGVPEIHSHMTAVSKRIRDGGVGEALKWQARQVALLFPQPAIEQLSVTFDNLQGRNSHLNLNKLGIICGAAGGRYVADLFGASTGAQHRGTPTDRFFGRWYLNSAWTLAHLHEAMVPLLPEEVKDLPQIIDFAPEGNSVGLIDQVIPTGRHDHLTDPVLAMAIPYSWDSLLAQDQRNDYNLANLWRQAVRQTLEVYFQNGYTTIAQVTAPDQTVNYQILYKNFDPFNPPANFIRQS